MYLYIVWFINRVSIIIRHPPSSEFLRFITGWRNLINSLDQNQAETKYFIQTIFQNVQNLPTILKDEGAIITKRCDQVKWKKSYCLIISDHCEHWPTCRDLNPFLPPSSWFFYQYQVRPLLFISISDIKSGLDWFGNT